MFEGKLFVTAAEIAPALGWKPSTFLRNRHDLIKNQAFPSPQPSGRVMRWYAPAVESWIVEYGTAATAAIQAAEGRRAANRDQVRLERVYGRAHA